MSISRNHIAHYISNLISEKLNLCEKEIERNASLFSIGVSSLVSEEILSSLNENYDGLSSTLLFEQPSINKLADFLVKKKPKNNAGILQQIASETASAEKQSTSDILSTQKDNQESFDEICSDNLPVADKLISKLNTQANIGEVAIIGIAGKFPQAKNPEELWSNLLKNKDSVTVVPEKRWSAESLYSTDKTNKNALYSKWGGFIEGIEYFDPIFFQIPHREAELMDPQQKLFLQCGWSLMENAGYGNPENRPTDNIGVYVGVTWNEFSIIAHEASIKEDTYKGAGSLYWSIPNRLSYFLNLKGPSVAIDSACSSSLVAINDACNALQTGQCEMAIAGGVNLNLHPDKYLFLSQNHFLSSEGKCRSFGEGGDGYVPGEGVAAVLLKPLLNAIEDGDHIYGVVKAASSNHGGKVTGYTVPNPVAHTQLIAHAIDKAGVNPADISYVECHGTGTDLGDPIEITGLTNAFSKSTEQKAYCGIGSIKSNIGHLEAAAGVTGLIKVLLSMKNKLLPASLHSKKENKKLSLSETPFYLIKENQEWKTTNNKLIAGISSFGAGGSNAHLLVENFIEDAKKQAKIKNKRQHAITLSAESSTQLVEIASSLLLFLEQGSDVIDLGDMAYSLLVGRKSYKFRLALSVKSPTELKKSLKIFLQGKGKNAKNIYISLPKGDSKTAYNRTVKKSKLSQLSVTKWCELWCLENLEESSYFEIKSVKDDVPYRRIPLPTYPFSQERSWITEGYPLVKRTLQNSNKVENTQALHPLIDKNISTLYEQKFKKKFNISEFVLKDHLVNEIHVIPGVCHLEIARKCAAEATQDKITIIKDVWFYNVIEVEEEKEVEVFLNVENEELHYTIKDTNMDLVFSRGKIDWYNLDSTSNQANSIEISAIKQEMTESWSIKDVYDKFVKTGIIQKQSFQVIKEILFNERQAVADLEIPSNLTESFEQFVLHPSLMDGLVQTAMMHTQYLEGQDIKILPFHFSEVCLVNPLEKKVTVVCEVVDRVNKQYNLIIYNRSGLPLVIVSGFILKAMKSESKKHDEKVNDGVEYPIKSNEVQVINSSYYQPVWLEHKLSENISEREFVLCFIGSNPYNLKLSGKKTIIQVQKGKAFSEKGNNFTIRYDDESDYISLIERLEERKQLPQLIIYATSITNTNSANEIEKISSANSSSLELSNVSGVSLFLLAKTILLKTQKLDWFVFENTQLLASSSYNLAATGLFKTMKVEKPNFVGRVISLESSVYSIEELIQISEYEIATQQDVFNIKYEDNKRYISKFQNLKATNNETTGVSFRNCGTYLITGGLGGIGLLITKFLVNQFQASVYLMGRSKLDENRQSLLNQINTACGDGKGSVAYLSCDVSDYASVNQLVKQICKKSGELNGIIHSAGIIKDAFILKKEKSSFEAVIAPKVIGANNLDLATKDRQLDFFCVFSSVTAILGNYGQIDYGYANAYLDNMVVYRNKMVKEGSRFGKSVSINWPYWKNGGMHLNEKEEAVLKRTFGLTPLADENGLNALQFALNHNIEQLAVLEGEQEKIKSILNPEDKQEDDVSEVEELADSNLKNNAINYLVEVFANELKIPKQKIEVNSSFERYGFDSIVMIDLINLMEKKFNNLPKTLFFEYQTIEELAEYFSQNHKAHFSTTNYPTNSLVQKVTPEAVVTDETLNYPLAEKNFKSESNNKLLKLSATKKLRFDNLIRSEQSDLLPQVALVKREYNDESIAIIGVAGQYPEADNISQYWDNLKNGRDSIREIPENLWDWSKFYKEGSPEQGKSYSKWGGFINNVDQFDAAYFNITPKEAEVIDPQERLFLQCATSAIQDAGYTAQNLTKAGYNKSDKENPVGVFVGVMWGDYQLLGVNSNQPSQWTTPRSFYWGIANRVSYFYNFSGPSLAIDSACSSSLSALHLACESIKRNEIEVAIAGGVNLTLHPSKYNLLSEMQFLSSDGRCRSFGEGGDGYVPGDGVGAVILKPLSKAVADGDNIYGVIRGSSLNHGGKTSGFTVPNPIRQASLIKSALTNARVSPSEVSYVEAHGTGTPLGDPVEMIGLKKAYQQEQNKHCAIGSVKSNIGHLEAAAGIAALTKVLLQLKHKKIVPSLHSNELNVNIDFSNTPFKVQQELSNWERPIFAHQSADNKIIETPRIAGISSFGAGGSNAHVIIEEYNEENFEKNTVGTTTPQAIIFSAKTNHSLTSILKKTHDYLKEIEFEEAKNENSYRTSLENIAYTLQVGRECFDIRIAFLAKDLNDLIEKIENYFQDEGSTSGADYYFNDLSTPNSLTYLFSEESNAREIVEKWIVNHDFKSLAIAWVSGISIEWSELYKNRDDCKRISLPTYVFDTKKFWTEIPSASSLRSSLHSLLDENISQINRQIFTKQFYRSDELVAHHQLRNIPTVPGAAFLEMALQAVLHSSSHDKSQCYGNNGKFEAQIKQLIWARPVSIQKEVVSTQIELISKNSGYIFQVGKQVEDEGKESLLACVQGEIELNVSSVSESLIESKALSTVFESHQAVDKIVIEERFASVGLQLGKSFDLLDTIAATNNTAISKIKSSPSGTDCIVSPQILDTIFRTCLAVNIFNTESWNLQVPVEVSQIELFDCLNQNCLVYAKLTKNNGKEFYYNIDVYSTEKILVATIRGFKTREIVVFNKADTPRPSQQTEIVKSSIVKKADVSQINSIEGYLKSVLSKVSKIETEEISSQVALEKYGIDSVMIMAMNEELENVFGELSKTLFFEYQDIQSLGKYFLQNYGAIVKNKLADFNLAKNKDSVNQIVLKEPISSVSHEILKLLDFNQLIENNRTQSSYNEKDIAVIGISGRFPEAGSVEELWDVLAKGKDCIKDIPLERWDINQFYEKETIEPGKISGKWGGFIDGFNEFDAHLFNVLPEQAKSMDPQERLFLQCVWTTLEDAGYTPTSLSKEHKAGASVGVFAGSMWNHYDLVGLEESLKGNKTINFAWDAAIPNRVSYFFDFKGPSISFDTACSSSLLAIHQACESLRKGECGYAIAGGINLSMHPYKYELLTQMQMLSSTGRCRSFGKNGDGYVPGEGVATVLLKPLSKALDDKDNIYGIIKGGSVNHNGKTNGLTVPSLTAQKNGFESALNMANLTPDDISYFEAHGTGTGLGDPIEFNAINDVFKTLALPESRCAIGSLKSNIGHLEGASGVAALIKVLLQMKHKKIVPSLHSQSLNPNLDFANSKLHVPQNLIDWESPIHKRRSAIASLGAGGANAYLVVEENALNKIDSTDNNVQEDSEKLFVFSAKNIDSLQRNLQEQYRYIEQYSNTLSPDDIAFTLFFGRIALEYRVAVKAKNLRQLVEKLNSISQFELTEENIHKIEGCWYGYAEKAMDLGWKAQELDVDSSKTTESLLAIDEAAVCWVSGESITSDRIFNKNVAKRISLPTYQFDKTIYWPIDSKPVSEIVTEGQAISTLVDENVSDFDYVAFRKLFKSGDPYISDHRVGSQRVIAGAVLIEMAIQAYLNVNRSMNKTTIGSIELSNLQWINPGIVENSLSTMIRFEPSENRFEIAEVSNECFDNEKSNYESKTGVFTSLLSGKLTLSKHAKELAKNHDHLQSLLERYSVVDYSQKKVYQYFKSLGLEYGNYFQVTSALHVDESHQNALVKLSTTSEGRLSNDEISIEPCLLDGALRATLLILERRGWKQLLIPQSINNINLICRMPKDVYAYIQITHSDDEFKTFVEANITIYDLAGNICLVISGFKALATSLTRKNKAMLKGNSNDARLQDASVENFISLHDASSSRLSCQSSNLTLASDNSFLLSKTTNYVKHLFSAATGLTLPQVKAEQSFDSMGVDSITIVKLNKLFEKDFEELSKTIFFECETLEQIATHLIENHREAVCKACNISMSVDDAVNIAAKSSVENVLISSKQVTSRSHKKKIKAIKEQIITYTKEKFSEATGIGLSQIRLEQGFELMGVDSITIVKLNKVFEQDLKTLSKTVFFECDSLNQVVNYFEENHLEELSEILGFALEINTLQNTTTRQDKKSKENAITTRNKAVTELARASREVVYINEVRRLSPLSIELSNRSNGEPVLVSFGFSEKIVVESFKNIQVSFDEVYREYRETNKFTIRKNNEKDLIKLFKVLLSRGIKPDVFTLYEEQTHQWFNEVGSDDIKAVDQVFKESVLFIKHLTKSITGLFTRSSADILFFHKGSLENAQPHWEAFDGLARTLSDINNRLFFSRIALNPSVIKDSQLFKNVIKNELLMHDRELISLEYDQFGQRYAYILEEYTGSSFVKKQNSSSLPLEDNGVYLITGGVGGLGKVTCRYLVDIALTQEKSISIGLLGRSPLGETVEAFIDELVTEQINIFYSSCDITENSNLVSAFDDIRKQKGMIKGVIHCAGVSADKGLFNANRDEFIKPLEAKCIGTINLDYATRNDPLDFFILYSSITAEIGDFGAGAYAMGNSFQNSYARQREYQRNLGNRSGLSLAIGWPLWNVDGLNQDSSVLQLYLDDFGMQPIDQAQGVQILNECWHKQKPQLSIYFGQRATILQKLKLVDSIKSLSLKEENSSTEEQTNKSEETKFNEQQLLVLESSYRVPTNSLFTPKAKEKEKTKLITDDIAIVGLSGRYPGANNLDEFWQNLRSAKDCISEIPLSRWDHKENYSDISMDWGAVNSKWGGFIADPDHFDALHFNISPREARVMDPQERLFLQTAYHCVEDAGYCRSALKGQKVGVYVGVMWGQYELFEIEQNQSDYEQPGASFSSIANRVSYYFDFKGPSLALDTMCSSSLTAIHLAKQSLLSGECDYVLAGGVNLTLHADKYHKLTQHGLLSSEGRCRSYGDGGDGYVPGEGVGVALLKRLKDAVRDGDHIYGVIKASSINHGGKSNSFTTPNPHSLSDVAKQALQEANWDPQTISYVEGHGTGTPLGDSIEVNSLSRIYNSLDTNQETKTQYCSIGSVKSNIGHLESASSIAGLTKILLQFKNKELVPSLHSETLNPNINFEKTPFSVIRNIKPWKKPELIVDGKTFTVPRRAALNTFGAGGSNAHLLIEEYCCENSNWDPIDNPFIFVFSGKTNEKLWNIVQQNINFLHAQQFEKEEMNERRFLIDFAFTLQVGREQNASRLAIVADTLEELIDKLESALNKDGLQEYYISESHQISNLESILDESQKLNLIESFLAKEDYVGIAKLWAESININWENLSTIFYPRIKPKRISIPNTPFIGQSYWFKKGSGKTSTTKQTNFARMSTQFNDVIHPLIDKNISTLFSQKYSKTFNSTETFLSDYVLHGKNTLPLAVFIEMARVATQDAIDELIVGFKNIQFEDRLNAKDKAESCIVKVASHFDELKFEISNGDPELPILYTNGLATLAGIQDSSHHVTSVNPLPNQGCLTDGMSQLEGDFVYQHLTRVGLKVSQSLRGIESLNYSQKKVVTALLVKDKTSNENNDLNHTILLESAFLSCSFISDFYDEDVLLQPFKIDTIRFFKPLERLISCHCELKEKQVVDGIKVAKFNLVFVQGKEIYCEIEGLSCRQLMPDSHAQISTQNQGKVASSCDTLLLSSINLQDDSVSVSIQESLAVLLSNIIGLTIEDIDVDTPFQSYGLNSVMLMEYHEKLNATFKQLSKTALFENDTVRELSNFVAKNHPDETKLFIMNSLDDKSGGSDANKREYPNRNNLLEAEIKSRSKLNSNIASRNQKTDQVNLQFSESNKIIKQTKVAVIGIGGVFPESPDIETFWKNIITGNDCLKEIPESRWSAGMYFSDSNMPETGKVSCKWGGFIPNPYLFDSAFFNMSKNEAAHLDPQLRMMLKVAWQTVEDAGYNPAGFSKDPVGVYIGVMNDDFTWHVSESYFESGVYSGPGSFASEIANRVSTMLNVGGPSLTVETACSSSTTAIHLARKAIINNECSMAIAGGVNLSLHHGKYLMLDQMKLLSSEGKEKTFDDSASGLVPGEAVAAVLLKNYEQAIADGDNIYGVISGSSIGHSGIGPAVNLPSVKSMETNVVKALEESKINIESIGLIESHGTGTELGDPIELKALSNAVNRFTDKKQFCAIGTKANFGHLESASGVCSLIKVLLEIKNNQIAPCANLNKVNSAFEESSSPLYFPRQGESWANTSDLKVAGINSFGMGGSNAFLVVESCPEQIYNSRFSEKLDGIKQIVVLSAESNKQVIQQVKDLLFACNNASQLTLESIAYTLQSGRRHYNCRVAFVVKSVPELIKYASIFLENPYESFSSIWFSGTTKTIEAQSSSLKGNEQEDTTENMAKNWVGGATLDLDVYERRGVKRCSLPGYPFNESEIKFSKQKSQKGNVIATPESNQPSLKANRTDVGKSGLESDKFPMKWFRKDIFDISGTNLVVTENHWNNSSINQIDKISKTMLSKIKNIDYVVEMTPVQKKQYEYFLKSNQEQWQQVRLSINENLDISLLKKAWVKLAESVDILRSIYIKNRNGYFRLVLDKQHNALEKVFGEIESEKTIRNDNKVCKLDTGFLPKKAELPYMISTVVTKAVDEENKTMLVWDSLKLLVQSNEAFELLRKLSCIYYGLKNNQEFSIQPQAFCEQNYKKVINGEQSGAIQNYWKEYLSDSSEIKALLRPSKLSSSCKKLINYSLDKELVSNMQKFTQQIEVEFETLFVTAWSLILSRLTKSKSALFSIAGKFRVIQSQHEKNVYGTYDDQIPVLINTVMRKSVQDWIKDTQIELDRKFDYAHVPFDTISGWVGLGDLCESLLTFEYSFDEDNDSVSSTWWQLNDYAVDKHQTSGFIIKVSERAESMELTLEFDSNRIEEDKAKEIIQYFEVVLSSMIEHPTRNPAAVPLTTKKEQRKKFWKTLENK
ncbi:SDR family NAD(P)-dependent oxidoreductase [Aliikangiella sp. IMCC44359]|uniref:SDR family NAD(P)-dependent oxidoreductase n=1 Tax=Aliikangiella sp. IMCC44359 TaxID=3459125 RepID=UPI00403B1F64